MRVKMTFFPPPLSQAVLPLLDLYPDSGGTQHNAVHCELQVISAVRYIWWALMEEPEWERVFLSDAVTFDMCRVTDSRLSSCHSHPSSGSLPCGALWFCDGSRRGLLLPTARRMFLKSCILTRVAWGKLLKFCHCWTSLCGTTEFLFKVMVWQKSRLSSVWRLMASDVWVIGLNKSKRLVDKTVLLRNKWLAPLQAAQCGIDLKLHRVGFYPIKTKILCHALEEKKNYHQFTVCSNLSACMCQSWQVVQIYCNTFMKEIFFKVAS